MLRKILSGNALIVPLALCLIVGFAVAAAAQNIGTIKGQVLDTEGKPWEGLTIKMSNDRGQKAQTVTDKEGRFTQPGLGNGKWLVEIIRGEQVIWRVDVPLATGAEVDIPPINFKELIEKTPEGAAAKAKADAEKAEFEGMKAHFDAGVLALQEADKLQATVAKTPADQKAALQQQIVDSRQKAVASFQEAEKAADPKDPNMSLILGNLGAAYKAAGQFEPAIEAYTRAVALKPDPGYYVGLAESQARSGKQAEAMASCANIPAATAGANAATCYRNLGIVLYNTNKFQEAIEPLQKATELDPKNAQAWYVLGASLVPLADFKEEQGKLIMMPKPGTIEAYRKAIELDPNGPYGSQAKEGLVQLEAMGAGIQTKVRSGKRRP
ncbi:MAG: tetratricopeptide repeat protein [Candidatus Acidiferrales bacterium]